MTNLKFTGLFKEGDIIKAFHFEPSPDRPDRYLIGKVLDANNTERGFQCYKIEILHDMVGDEDEIGDYAEDERVGFVPHQISMLEFDERISLFTE